MINQYYWYRLRLEVGAKAMRSALYYFPHDDVGSIVNVSGAAVLASSRHRRTPSASSSSSSSPAASSSSPRATTSSIPREPGVAANGALPPLAKVPHTTLSVVKLGNDQKAAQLIANAGFGS